MQRAKITLRRKVWSGPNFFNTAYQGHFSLNTAGQGQFLFYIRLARAEFSFIYGWPGANFLLYTAGQRHGQGPIFFIYGWPRPGPAFFLYTAGQGQSFFKYMASQRQGQGRFFFTYGWPGPKILLYTVAVLKISNGLGQLWHVQYTFITFFLYTVFFIYDFFYMLSYYLCRAARRAKFFLYTFILPLLDFGRGRPQYIKKTSR